MPLVAAITPHWFHLQVANRLRKLDDEASDPFPTYYRMNSRRAVRSQAAAAGLEVAALEMLESEPSYGRSSRLLFYPFMIYERVVNGGEWLQDLRSNILATLRLGQEPAA